MVAIQRSSNYEPSAYLQEPADAQGNVKWFCKSCATTTAVKNITCSVGTIIKQTGSQTFSYPFMQPVLSIY